MTKAKNLLIFVTIVLALAFCVSAQPPFAEPQIGQATEGLIIEYPQYMYIQQGQNFTLHTHVIDGLNGTIITNETTYCFLHLYDKYGRHVLQENMSWSENGLEFELYISEGNFTDLGVYAYIIQCNGTEGGGFDAGNFEVTEEGLTQERRDITYIIIGLAIIMAFYIFMAYEINTFSVKILMYGIALLEMLNICFVMYANEFFEGFYLILQINFITNLIIGFGVGMIALIIMLIRFANPQDPMADDEIKWKESKWGKLKY